MKVILMPEASIDGPLCLIASRSGGVGGRGYASIAGLGEGGGFVFEPGAPKIYP
jgi:hypothetical protein